MNQRDPKQIAESVAIPMHHCHTSTEHDGHVFTENRFLDRAVAHWLIERGVKDDVSSCEWWIDQVNEPHCIRIWIADESLRMMFKLTWGGK